MPGYLREILHCAAEKHLCTDCLLILRDPYQNACGHRFCHSCLMYIIRRSNGKGKCPECMKEDPDGEESDICMEEVNPDFGIRRDMKNLPAKCVNCGCTWTGIFVEYVKHESTCEYALLYCINEGCSERILRRHLDIHLKDECTMRLIDCEFCQIQMCFRDLKSHHDLECPKILIHCEYCDTKLRREQLEAHIHPSRGTCSRRRQPCKFHRINCKELVQKDKQSQHDVDAIQHHMHLLLQKISNYKLSDDIEKNLKEFSKIENFMKNNGGKIDSLRNQVSRLEDDLKEALSHIKRAPIEHKGGDVYDLVKASDKTIQSLKNKLDSLERKVTTYEGIVAILNSQVENDADLIQSMKNDAKRTHELLQAIERKVKAQDRIIALKDVLLAEQDLRIQSLEMASYDGILTWRISGFARKRRDAISGRTLSIYSPYFFTSRSGYKMCVRVYLNGDGMGKGSHISLFFVMMRGEYDAILQWPFKQKVTFMWIDQNNRNHVLDAFRPDPDSNSFKRPTSDLNIASGCPLFLSLATLDSGNNAYVKDDVAYLRIIVDTSDL